MLRRRRKKQAVEMESLGPMVLPAQDGTPMLSYPAGTIDQLCQMMTRIGREADIPDRIAFVSALREEGVTYTARATGLVLANAFERTVCVVGLNWWWPADLLPAGNQGGIAGVLTGETELDDAIVPTGIESLHFLPAGKMPRQDRPVLARSQQLRDIIEELSTRYDQLILDIPAILAIGESVPLASLSNGCCLVLRQGVTATDDVREALDEIDHLPMLGVVMNKNATSTPNWLVKLIPGR